MPRLARLEVLERFGQARLEADVRVDAVLVHVFDRLALLGTGVPQLTQGRVSRGRTRRRGEINSKKKLTTASGKLVLVTLTESVRPLYAIVSSSGARKYTRSTSPLGPSTSTTLRDSLTFCAPDTLSL